MAQQKKPKAGEAAKAIEETKTAETNENPVNSQGTTESHTEGTSTTEETNQSQDNAETPVKAETPAEKAPSITLVLSSAKHPDNAEPKELRGKFIHNGFAAVQVSRIKIKLPATADGQPDSESQRAGFLVTAQVANLLQATYPGVYKVEKTKSGGLK